MYNVSSSRVCVCIDGSSPARTRHSTTAQSPPDCSPGILSSALEPWPDSTVRPAPGAVRIGSDRDIDLPPNSNWSVGWSTSTCRSIRRFRTPGGDKGTVVVTSRDRGRRPHRRRPRSVRGAPARHSAHDRGQRWISNAPASCSRPNGWNSSARSVIVGVRATERTPAFRSRRIARPLSGSKHPNRGSVAGHGVIPLTRGYGLGLRACWQAGDESGERGGRYVSDGVEKAILAGGCFWGMEDLFRKRPGVISTRVGYTGGHVPNATYRNHGTHAEAIEIVFNPERTSYRELLEFFFQIHDPTTLNRQGNDIGASYRSAIFYLDEEQRRGAEGINAHLERWGRWPGKVVTEVTPAGPFWEAEPEHQDYLERYPYGYTCHFPRPGWVLYPTAARRLASRRHRSVRAALADGRYRPTCRVADLGLDADGWNQRCPPFTWTKDADQIWPSSASISQQWATRDSDG